MTKEKTQELVLWIGVGVAVVLVVFFIFGGGPDPSRLQKLVHEHAVKTEALAKTLESAIDATTLAAALTDYTKETGAFSEAYKAEINGNPDLEAFVKDSPPEGLKQAQAEQSKANEALMAALSNLAFSPLLEDPTVADAYQKLNEASSK